MDKQHVFIKLAVSVIGGPDVVHGTAVLDQKELSNNAVVAHVDESADGSFQYDMLTHVCPRVDMQSEEGTVQAWAAFDAIASMHETPHMYTAFIQCWVLPFNGSAIQTRLPRSVIVQFLVQQGPRLCNREACHWRCTSVTLAKF